MKLPTNACPVAYMAIREFMQPNIGAYAHLQEGMLAMMAGLTDDEWGEMKELSCTGVVTPQTIRARAFFALELIYTELVPMQFFAANHQDLQEEMMNLRIPRTVEGMKQLSEKSDKLRKRCGSRAAMSKFKGKQEDVQMFFQMSKPAESFQRLSEICDVLAGCLRRGDVKGMTKVGECLGWMMQQSYLPKLDAEQMVRALLGVTAENPIHPWQRET